MKYIKILILSLLVCNIALISCKEENNVNPTKQEVSAKDKAITQKNMNINNSKLKKSGHEMRMEIIKYPVESQRIIFASKTPEEKNEIWKDKLNFSMQNTSFNDIQQELLMELYNRLTPNLFVPNSTENLSFYEFHRNWIINAKREFPYFLIKNIVSSLNDNGLSYSPPSGGGTSCNCSQSSDWCDERWRCSYPSTGCDSRALGCGTLLLYSCDGLCAYSFEQ